jgi:hypothetical protein
METGARLLRRLAAALVMLAALSSGGAAQAALSPRQLYQALLKPPPSSSLPPALRGSITRSTPLSTGARSHHAVGAVEISNGTALVGFLVFPTHALALADLKAFPPNRGPNKIVTTRPAGFPRPAYVLRASGNGYSVAYMVFIQDNLLVNTWTYGRKGTEKQLIAIVEGDARWAKSYSLRIMRNGK